MSQYNHRMSNIFTYICSYYFVLYIPWWSKKGGGEGKNKCTHTHVYFHACVQKDKKKHMPKTIFKRSKINKYS